MKLESAETDLDKTKVAEARLVPAGNFTALFVPSGKILGDIMAPTVAYEDYTFDENNICPEEYAQRQLASDKKD